MGAVVPPRVQRASQATLHACPSLPPLFPGDGCPPAGAQPRSTPYPSLTTQPSGGCWQIKYYYRNGTYADVFFHTGFNDSQQSKMSCADGCVYMRLGDHDGTRHCFVESWDEGDEVMEDYIRPTPSCS